MDYKHVINRTHGIAVQEEDAVSVVTAFFNTHVIRMMAVQIPFILNKLDKTEEQFRIRMPVIVTY